MAIKKKYNFESGGNTRYDLEETLKDIASKEVDLPLSIKTPLEISTKDDLFKMHYNLKDVLNDQIKNLIYTEPGERLCFPTIGTSLKNLVAQNDDLNATIDNISNEIKNVLTRYASGIILNSVSAVYSEEEKRKYNIPVVIITINYSFYEKMSVYNDLNSASVFNVVKRDSSMNIKIGLNN
jgi:phage baseplate assembly protein W